jgi:hypothetical protein
VSVSVNQSICGRVMVTSVAALVIAGLFIA